jgi:hypothetical protein
MILKNQFGFRRVGLERLRHEYSCACLQLELAHTAVHVMELFSAWQA